MQGEVVHTETLRYTPAGIPVLSFVLHHVSEQVEAGVKRKIECELNAMALGELARQSQHMQIGARVSVSGFIARRSLKSTQLVLHTNTIESII